MGILIAWLGRDSGCETGTGSFRPGSDQRAGKRTLTDSPAAHRQEALWRSSSVHPYWLPVRAAGSQEPSSS